MRLARTSGCLIHHIYPENYNDNYDDEHGKIAYPPRDIRGFLVGVFYDAVARFKLLDVLVLVRFDLLLNDLVKVVVEDRIIQQAVGYLGFLFALCGIGNVGQLSTLVNLEAFDLAILEHGHDLAVYGIVLCRVPQKRGGGEKDHPEKDEIKDRDPEIAFFVH